MPRVKTKTVTTTIKMSPQVKELWEALASQEHRSLANMFEVMVRDYAERHLVTVQSVSTNQE